jgi:Na+:H+ antiporter, NhaA family
MNRRPPPVPSGDPFATRLFAPLERFLHVEASSGLVLLAAAMAALLWANSPWADAYEAFWHAPIRIGLGTWLIEQPLHFWINDGLMTIFFLVVGLEIRRELHDGALSSPRLAALPVAAALGGIFVPALLYLVISSEPGLRRGWAIPTATDIAFAVGVLAILGPRIPAALRALLLALAIVDDIAAILVIALFYSAGIEPVGFLVAALGVAGVLAFQRLGIRRALAYTIPGFFVWLGLLQAGVHPTLAGVMLGLLTPAVPLQDGDTLLRTARRALEDSQELRRARRDTRELVRPIKQLALAHREMVAPVVRVEALLHPWVAFGIMPLFALANSGVSFEGVALGEPESAALAAGVACALLIGKPVGIALAAWLALKSNIALLPSAVSWRGIALIGLLGGIGFTMSIFIANLAFADTALLASAKFAVLVASTAAALGGLLFGRVFLPAHAVPISTHAVACDDDSPQRKAAK